MQPYNTSDKVRPPLARLYSGAWVRQHARLLVRMAWLMLCVLLLALHVLAVPSFLALMQQACTKGPCVGGQVFAKDIRILDALGLSIGAYGVLSSTLRLVGVLVYTAVAAVLVWRRPDDRMAVLAAFMLLLDGTIVAGIIGVLVDERDPLLLGLVHINNTLVTCFFYLFPRRHFEPPWTRWLALFWVVSGIVLWSIPPSLWTRWLGGLATLQLDGWLLSLGAMQIYRFRTARTTVERQQSKWVMLGVSLGYGSFALLDLARFATARLGVQPALLTPLVTANVLVLLAPLVPITFGLAILRARLYDIDVIISRTLVYGALTACVAGVYVLLVGLLGQLVQAQTHPFLGLLAVGVIAIAFQPLRVALQRGVNRLLYGHRDEPYVVLARLGQRLGLALSPGELLPTVVETVRETLKIPYAAIVLREDDAEVIAAASGAPTIETTAIPLVHQHVLIGQLVLGQRSPGERFTRAEQRLLTDLAHHISIAVHAVRLTHDLQRSRTHLVTAREEERRRLQRDLHDGFGPTLASITMQLDAARALMVDDPATSGALLDEVQEELKATVGNVRRLVHSLRPPVLDQFGLLRAVREYALRAGQMGRLCITVDAPETLPPLPAAVEVAAYYIVTEALTNAIRHARASHCVARLAMLNHGATEALKADTSTDEQSAVTHHPIPPASHQTLIVEVVDDGVGLPEQHTAGVGLHSMRERAAELGGTWTITSAPGSTTVRAVLPF